MLIMIFLKTQQFYHSRRRDDSKEQKIENCFECKHWISGKGNRFILASAIPIQNKLSAPGTRIECKLLIKRCMQGSEYVKLLHWTWWWWQLLIMNSSNEQNFRCLLFAWKFMIQPKKLNNKTIIYAHDLRVQRSYYIHTVCCLLLFFVQLTWLHQMAKQHQHLCKIKKE